ncbi:MAG: hypothetical protein ACE5OZ_00815 [Candidatus Heimdallarchaeota archaeon]
MGSLAATHDAVKILELINAVPNKLQNKCSAYLGAFLVYQLTEEQLAEEKKEDAQDDFLVDIKTFPEEDEATKMKTSVLGASSLDILKAGRWGDMTRYLTKKGIANLSMAKSAAHTIQVVDVETLMRQFDATIQRLDTLVRKTPNGERIMINKIADEIDQMKNDLYDDFYNSVERLQKESSYMSLTKHYPMDGGKPTFAGKITVPALCGVLANILEGAPTSARVKRAFIMEMLLKSLSFLDEIDELKVGLNLSLNLLN